MGCHVSHAFSNSQNRFLGNISVALRGSQGTILHPRKNVLGCKECQIRSWGETYKFLFHQVVYFIFCGRTFQHKYGMFVSSNVNLEAVASLGAILYSFAVVSVYIFVMK